MAEAHGAPARTRPGMVTISSYLLILFALTQVVDLILRLVTIGPMRDVLRDLYAGTANGSERIADVAVFFVVAQGVLMLLIAVALVVLAVLNNRGRNGARIATWVLGGIMVCCTGGSLISSAVGSFVNMGTGPSTGDMPSGQEIERRLSEALPSWLGPVTILVGVIGLLALVAALILLALPQANDFFRRPRQPWEPPVPGSGYPGYPGYPYAGYPPAPGYPGYPSAPAHPQAGPQAPGQAGWPPGPGQPGDLSTSGQWQQPTPPPAPPASAPPAAGPPEPGEGEPGRSPAAGADRPGESDRPGPNPPSES